MLFSSITFLYYFLAVCFALYFSVPKRYKNAILLVASLCFYFAGETKYIFLLFFSTVLDYSMSFLIVKYRDTWVARFALITSIVVNLGLLGFFKYSNFFISNINSVFGASIPLLNIALPLGISFYTFQTMSYTIDVYRGEAGMPKNIWDFATYVTLFPQLVAGPIVRYKTIEEELRERSHSFSDFAIGVRRFTIGLAKKVLIANTLGELATMGESIAEASVLFFWMKSIAFMLQIYFDFSGYSDMAIGLGRMFGFKFLENFNYPFISKSITEFWQRWHISLGTWFKDYLYIPLGGNRVPKWKWYRNILIVWFCTGFWHGAAYNFILWGLIYGGILVIEKQFLLKYLEKMPKFIRSFYVLFISVLLFAIFNSNSMTEAIFQLKGMFGFNALSFCNAETLYYLRSYLLILIIGVIASTQLPMRLIEKIKEKNTGRKIVDYLEPVCYPVLIIIITGYLVDSSFNPFLYFRF